MLIQRPKAIVGISFALACTFLTLCVLVLSQMRHDAERRAEDAAINIALLVDRDTTRNLELYDLSLQAVIDRIRQPGLATLPPEIRQEVLFDRSTSAQDLGSIFVTDAAGDVLYDSRSVLARRFNLADRDYFKAQRDATDVGLYVSRPFLPRAAGTALSIALSRRLSNPDGSFAGVVVGTLRLDYFRRLFEGMELGPNGTMALILTDGTMLMRRPYDVKIIGRNITGTGNFTRFMLASSGAFYGTAALDGVPRWYVFRHIGRFPIILDVALSTGDMYAEWRNRAWILGSIVCLLDVLIMGFAVLFSRQVQELQHTLAVEAELRVLVRTDGLTGLGNRRGLDEMAAIQWRVAQRSGQPLSVLLIDVDHFKRFNDMYGHAAGDDALRAVAGCIKAELKRPADHATRYGGEEFLVLLPNTDSADAYRIAERIRVGVEALGVRHVSTLHHTLTVSVGVASTRRGGSGDWLALVNAADAALYAAKDAGRNQTMRDDAGGTDDAARSGSAAPARFDADDR